MTANNSIISTFNEAWFTNLLNTGMEENHVKGRVESD